jgi:predicted nucleotidyltransferase
MEKLLTQLTEKLKQAYGANLASVVLYGSAARGDHHAAWSDLNVFCLLHRLGREELALAEPILRWWRGRGQPAPLLMSVEEARRSTDCFPIEFHDLQESRRLLHGEDVLAGFEVHDRFYRALVEHELRAKLLRLRQKAAGVLHDRDLLVRLMADSVSTFCMLARHALRLARAEAPAGRTETLEACAARFGLDPAAFYTLLDLRAGKLKPKQVEPERLFDDYLAALNTLIEAVDQIGDE